MAGLDRANNIRSIYIYIFCHAFVLFCFVVLLSPLRIFSFLYVFLLFIFFSFYLLLFFSCSLVSFAVFDYLSLQIAPLMIPLSYNELPPEYLPLK